MNQYLFWLANKTKSVWWNDSADIDELKYAISNGAQGVTTNPVLIASALYGKSDKWRSYLHETMNGIMKEQKAEEIIRRLTVIVAGMFKPIYDQTGESQGYVCAQVDPRFSGDRDAMLKMALRMHDWAPNIAVKIPATAAGLDVLEECIALGITITATVSFTVPQALAIGHRHQIGMARAIKAGIKPGRCFAAVMIGRLDDYMRDIILDRQMNITPSDIIQCGLAVIKRSYEYYNKHNYQAILMPAAMRGDYHVLSLSGAAMSMSIHPKIQSMLENTPAPYHENINIEVDDAVVKRLMKIPEFVRAYEPDGMKPEDFITYGVVQKTLAQFTEQWVRIEEYPLFED